MTSKNTLTIGNDSLVKLWDKCSTINAVGINRLVMQDNYPKAPDEMEFRGIDEKQSIVIVNTYEQNLLPEKSHIGMLSLATFLNRLSLFDLEKVEATLDVFWNDYWNEAHKLNLKQGRRKASYSFTQSTATQTPMTIAQDEPIFDFELTKSSFGEIQKAIQSMRVSQKGAEGFTIEYHEDDGIYLKLNDGISDMFEEKIGSPNDQTMQKSWSHCWQTRSIETLLREALKTNEEDKTMLRVCEQGLGKVKVNELEFTVLPYIEKQNNY